MLHAKPAEFPRNFHGKATEFPRNFHGKLAELFSQYPQPFLIRFNLALFF